MFYAGFMSTLSFTALRIKDFRLLLFTRVFSMMALQAQAVIVGWQIYSLTKNPFMLGLTGLTEALPAIGCALFAGHVVDISRPHRVYFLSIGALTLNTFTLLLLAGGFIALQSHAVILAIFIGVFISGASRGFIMPASFSLLPRIVTRADISSASGWLSSGFQLATICGPAIAGLVYGGYGARAAWFLPTSLMLAGLCMLTGISDTHRRYRSEQKREPARQSIAAGWRFILHNRVLLSVMALDMFAVLFGGATAMLPAYADRVLHVGSEGLGALRAAPALGAIVSALVFAMRPFRLVRGSLLLWVITGFGISMIGFGSSNIFWVSMICLAASGAFDSVSMVMRGTLMQLLTPDAMRGRVSAVNSMFIISSNEIGAFESGLAAKLLGLVPSVIIGGIGTLVVVATTAWLSPQLRKLVVDSHQPAT